MVLNQQILHLVKRKQQSRERYGFLFSARVWLLASWVIYFRKKMNSHIKLTRTRLLKDKKLETIH